MSSLSPIIGTHLNSHVYLSYPSQTDHVTDPAMAGKSRTCQTCYKKAGEP
jgi:hypothetical protein